MQPRPQMFLTCFACGLTTSGSDLALTLQIVSAGFVIEAEDNRVLTENQVRDFYSQIAEQVRKCNKTPPCFQIEYILTSFRSSLRKSKCISVTNQISSCSPCLCPSHGNTKDGDSGEISNSRSKVDDLIVFFWRFHYIMSSKIPCMSLEVNIQEFPLDFLSQVEGYLSYPLQESFNSFCTQKPFSQAIF